jgi:hypothetical protein
MKKSFKEFIQSVAGKQLSTSMYVTTLLFPSACFEAGQECPAPLFLISFHFQSLGLPSAGGAMVSHYSNLAGFNHSI